MKYIKGFKYQLIESESCQTDIFGYSINDLYYSLSSSGKLTGKRGFAWDGSSGSIDTKTNLRASMFHDIGCLMVARNQLPRHTLDMFNVLFHKQLKEDNMIKIRRWWHFKAITKHFSGNKSPKRRKVYELINGQYKNKTFM